MLFDDSRTLSSPRRCHSLVNLSDDPRLQSGSTKQRIVYTKLFDLSSRTAQLLITVRVTLRRCVLEAHV